MPCTYQIHSSLDLLLLRHRGEVTVDEQRQVMAELSEHRAYHGGIRLLVDASGLTDSAVDLPSLLARRDRHAEQLRDLERPTRWSYYAPNDLGYGMCRRAQIMFGELPNLEIGVFRCPEETLAFLDLPADAIDGWP